MLGKKMSLVLVATLFSVCAIASDGEAQQFILNKVVDRNTPIPGGSGTFPDFFGAVISGSNVAFAGHTGGGLPNGIYLFNGIVLAKVADRNTPVPEGTGNFFAFGYPVISGNNVAFTNDEGTGIYLFNGTALAKVADRNTPVPEGTGNFFAFGYPVISGNNVAFTNDEGTGIYILQQELLLQRSGRS